MALLLRQPEISSITGRGAPARSIPRIRSSKNARISLCSVKDSEMVVLRMRSESFDGVRWLYGQVTESKTAPFKGKVEEEMKRYYYGSVRLGGLDETYFHDIL